MNKTHFVEHNKKGNLNTKRQIIEYLKHLTERARSTQDVEGAFADGRIIAYTTVINALQRGYWHLPIDVND